MRRPRKNLSRILSIFLYRGREEDWFLVTSLNKNQIYDNIAFINGLWRLN